MKRDLTAREPERDPVLAAALRDLYGTARLDPARGAALAQRIRREAEASSGDAAPARSAPRRRWPLAWRLAPALLAAALAAVFLVSRHRGEFAPRPIVHPAGFASAEDALRADLSDTEFRRHLTLQDDPAAALLLAVDPAARPPQP